MEDVNAVKWAECEASGPYNGARIYSSPLGYEAVWTGTMVYSYQRFGAPCCLHLQLCKTRTRRPVGWAYPEDGSSKLLRNTGTYIQIFTASSKAPEFFKTRHSGGYKINVLNGTQSPDSSVR
jgi:hypothetical protein